MTKEGSPHCQALREAQLFRTCLHLRRQQRRQLLAEALQTANAKDASEADLIFALDRSDFYLQQLTRLTALPDAPFGWDASAWTAKAGRAQHYLVARRRLRQELDEQWSQAQLALRRIRTLMSFAAKACAYEGAAGARCQDLAAVLQSCEVALLKGTNEMPTIPVGPSETSSVFLESILPKLLSEDSTKATDDRGAEEECEGTAHKTARKITKDEATSHCRKFGYV
ncbi:unnamed protein product [Durusdinium trenchii]|uniref:Uncharacterized protein n=1 Tax=Durusdinium trenchii TaxID=1381693 RepID=A0ABP0SU15_9DINO